MVRENYRYSFASGISFDAVEESLLLAVLSAEGVYGRSRVRLDGWFSSDTRRRRCYVDATTDVGRHIAQVFNGLLTKEFGEEEFEVDRVADSEGENAGASDEASLSTLRL